MDKNRIDILPFYQYENFVFLTDEEQQLVLSWRNDEKVRKWMYNTDIITLENHLNFIESLKNNQSKKYWIVQRYDKKIGVMSVVDIKEGKGEWGYYLAPELHATNLSVEFYYHGLKYLFEVEKMNELYGYARIDNKSANSLNDMFFFEKKMTSRKIGDTELPFFYRELTHNVWDVKIKNNDRIEKFLNFTINKYK